LATFGERQYELCGFDLSRDAVEAAAKAARRESLDSHFAVASLFELPLAEASVDAVASLFELPLAEASVDAVVNIFAPCAEAEFCRVLKPGGVLILVGAGERHLLGLKRALYDETYENAQRADLPAGMALVERQVVRDEIVVVGKEQIEHLFSMTPYYWRTSSQDKQKLSQLERLVTEIEFDCRVYRKIQ
jgi:23S rRNA (guanine745-N1)-methyltransferase